MSLYKRKDSSFWWVKLTIGSRRVSESTGTASKRQAQEYHDKLKTGKALPPSQVVRTTPRSGTPGKADPITAAQVPAIAARPAAADAITMLNANTVFIPD